VLRSGFDLTIARGRLPNATSGYRRPSVDRSNAATASIQARPAAVEVVVESLEDLLGAVACGDEAVFARLYDRVSGPVYGLALRIVGDAASAEEVAHQALLDIWRTAARFDRDHGSAITFILTIVRLRAVELVRQERSGRAPERRQALRPATLYDAVASAVDSRSDWETVRQCLSALTAVQREAVELAYFDGYTSSEMAALLGVDSSTVRTRIRDGLVRLRIQLEQIDR
jgi:RNA polymerase sigma-70 factor (ECF subfamily)